jgi:hypothetical protein
MLVLNNGIIPAAITHAGASCAPTLRTQANDAKPMPDNTTRLPPVANPDDGKLAVTTVAATHTSHGILILQTCQTH